MCRDLLNEYMQKSWDDMNRQRSRDEARIRDEEEAKKAAATKAEARAEIVAKLREKLKEAEAESIRYGQCPDHHREWRLRSNQIYRDLTWIEAGCPK